MFVGRVFTGAATGTAITTALAGVSGYPPAFTAAAGLAAGVTAAGLRLLRAEAPRR